MSWKRGLDASASTSARLRLVESLEMDGGLRERKWDDAKVLEQVLRRVLEVVAKPLGGCDNRHLAADVGHVRVWHIRMKEDSSRGVTLRLSFPPLHCFLC